MEAGLNEALNKRVASKLWKDAVAKLQDQKKQLEKYRSEYETLESTLKTLPSKIKHTVMVPLGTMGMMPGHIYHTNEVLVLLGENYFAKRSAEQAIEILRRRKQYVEANIQNVSNQIQQFVTRLKYEHELEPKAPLIQELDDEGVVEIREEYNEEEENAKMVTARKATPSTEIRDRDDSDLFARLDELERQEELARRKEELAEMETESHNNKMEESEEEKEEGEEEEGNEEEGEEVHEEGEEVNEEEVQEIEEYEEEEETIKPPLVLTPGDLYENYYKTTTLLTPGAKVKKQVHFEPQIAKDQMEETKQKVSTSSPQTQQPLSSAFTGLIVERSENTSEQQQQQAQEEPPKRVSLFKQQRMKKP